MKLLDRLPYHDRPTALSFGPRTIDVRGHQIIVWLSLPELIAALAGLRRERERQGLSLTDMAERTGIDRATISKLETGKIANPTIGTLRTYAKALGRRLAWTLEVVAKPDMASQ